MLTAAFSLSVYPDCPGASCTGTAWERHMTAREAARDVDLNQPWYAAVPQFLCRNSA